MVLIKTEAEIEIMAESGRRLAFVLRELKGEVRPGITTLDLDARARELVRETGTKPAFLGYKPTGALKPYPAVLCVSVNDTVVHGVPSDYVIRPGDVVKIDMGVIHEGYYSDAAFTVAVPPVSKDVARLLQATEESLERAIKMARPGNTLGDIGSAVAGRVKQDGFTPVDQLTGHGIGLALHEDPYVFNVGRKGEGDVLRAGMVIAIEPMISMGKPGVRQGKDDSFITKDGSLSAHFEHTVAVTDRGPRVLTR